MQPDMLLTADTASVGRPAFDTAVLRTVAYSDIFDYPLNCQEIHRYLEGLPSAPAQVEQACQALLALGALERVGDFWFLPGRAHIVEQRAARAAWSKQLWPKVQRYAAWMARLPYVRMLAVTGALALDNEPGRDIDFLVAAASGRVWLCRALVILVVRWAARSGEVICPNYIISENALEFSARNLYTAHELAQMIPLFGMPVYWKIRQANSWLLDYLPNAIGLPRDEFPNLELAKPAFYRPSIEKALSFRWVDRLEAWEMQRKQRKFARVYPASAEADFSAECCKGHFGEYGARTLSAFEMRLDRSVGVERQPALEK
jgi:hypothetical protein